MQRDLRTIHGLAHGNHCSRQGVANSSLRARQQVKRNKVGQVEELRVRSAVQCRTHSLPRGAVFPSSAQHLQAGTWRQCCQICQCFMRSQKSPHPPILHIFLCVKSPDFSILADNSNYFKYHRPNITCLWARDSLPVCSCCWRA